MTTFITIFEFGRNPTPKKAVGFFFKGDKPVAANETMFVATILGIAAFAN
jgi:hypothetical protein